MYPAQEPDARAQGHDDLLTVEISPPLPCGVARCDQPARWARVERDPDTSALWRLLPICDAHRARLAASAADIARALHRDAPTNE